MAIHFTFHEPESVKDLKELTNFLWEQDLGYPKYDEWVERAIIEVENGYKNAIIARDQNTILGDIIYQPHKEFSRLREIKNIRVHSDIRGRFFGAYLIRQAEIETKNEYDIIMVDARANQRDVQALFRFCGYQTLGRTHLYDQNIEDVIMVKSFNKRTPEGLLHK